MAEYKAEPYFESEVSMEAIRPGSTVLTLEKVKELYENVKRFWSTNRERFIESWNKMSDQSKENMITNASPYTPYSPTKTKVRVNGEYHDVTGACLMYPDMTLKNLIEDDGLIKQFDKYTNDNWFAQMHSDLDMMCNLMNTGLLKGGKAGQRTKTLVCVYDEEHFGDRVAVLKEIPKLDEYRKNRYRIMLAL